MRRRFKADPKWIMVRHPARCAEPNCQTQINSGERGFYYPCDKSLYGSRCEHGEKAERDFGRGKCGAGNCSVVRNSCSALFLPSHLF
jgi:hypothetical protein